MAINFIDAQNEYVTIPTGQIVLSNQDFSISCWIRRTRTNDRDPICNQGVDTAGNGFEVQIMQSGAGNVVRFRIATGDTLDSNGAISDTTDMHHIVITYNAATNLQAIYIDGVLDNSRTATNDYAGTGIFYVGRNILGEESQGDFDDFRIYDDYVLSAAEVATMYVARGRDDIRTNLVCRFTFLEAAPGTTASGAGSIIDVSGSGNNGTPVNTPRYAADSMNFRRQVA